MKILHVISSMDPSTGGPCQAVRNMVPALAQLGIKGEVVCLDGPSAPFLPNKNDPFLVHALGPAQGPWAYSGQLYKWLLANMPRFDRVIVHGLWLYSSYAACKAFKYLKQHKGAAPRLYVMPHGMLDPYFQNAPDRRLKAIRNIIYWKLVESTVVNSADGVLFTCAEEMNLAALPFKPYKPKNTVNVGLGITAAPEFNVDMQYAFSSKCAPLSQRPYLLFLGRVHIKKGVDILLDAYAELIKNRPGESAAELPCLVVAGPGLDGQYGKLLQQKAIGTQSMHNKVFFTGMLEGDAKWGAFYGAEAFVLPSHQENFGIAVAEALACGKPVLLSNKVNIWREIESAGAGFICEDSLTGVEQMLRNWVKSSYSERNAMGSAAKECYSVNFAVGPAAKKLANAITT